MKLPYRLWIWPLTLSGLMAGACSEAPEKAATGVEETRGLPGQVESVSTAPEAAQNQAEPSDREGEAEAKPDVAAALFPEILGVESPIDADILWTAYYITPVTQSEGEDGDSRVLSFTSLAGKKVRYSVTGDSFHRAELEAVAVGVDKEGHKRFAYRVEEGVWQELPPGSMGMGNRMNPLIPLVHIAADQSRYPYGSLVYVPGAVGYDFGNGVRLSGYFWVADSGGQIRGDHFDLFVGQEEVYSGFLDSVKNQHHATRIYPLPALDKSWDPHDQAGLARVLTAAGFLRAVTTDGAEVQAETLKEALVAFQKGNPLIPAAEYGNADAAVSRWFLTQAAIRAMGQGDPSGAE